MRKCPFCRGGRMVFLRYAGGFWRQTPDGRLVGGDRLKVYQCGTCGACALWQAPRQTELAPENQSTKQEGET